jgi:hypothetical protein
MRFKMILISVSDTDPDWIRVQLGQWIWIQESKNSLLRTEGFSCSLDVLYGGQGISKLQFLIICEFVYNF